MLVGSAELRDYSSVRVRRRESIRREGWEMPEAKGDARAGDSTGNWSGCVNASPVRTELLSIRGSVWLAHEQRQAIAKVLLGLVHVVGATPELDVLEDCLAAGGVWLHVVEFQEATLPAA